MYYLSHLLEAYYIGLKWKKMQYKYFHQIGLYLLHYQDNIT